MGLCQEDHTTASTGNGSTVGNHYFFDQLAKEKQNQSKTCVSHYLITWKTAVVSTNSLTGWGIITDSALNNIHLQRGKESREQRSDVAMVNSSAGGSMQ